ncbi:MAG: hypothetical protein IT380_14545 [Myxococcales bacterium]|nr:hypothetical protein [Myxococcales bacterium]
MRLRSKPVLALLILLATAAPGRARAQAAPDPDPWWGPDKALHLGISAALASGSYAVTAFFTEQRPVRLAVGAGVTLLAGGTKELIDLAAGGSASWKDFTWDVIGCAAGLLVTFLLDVLVITPLTRPPPTPAPG